MLKQLLAQNQGLAAYSPQELSVALKELMPDLQGFSDQEIATALSEESGQQQTPQQTVRQEPQEKPSLSLGRLGGAFLEGMKSSIRGRIIAHEELARSLSPLAAAPRVQYKGRSVDPGVLGVPSAYETARKKFAPSPEYEGQSSGLLEDFSRGLGQMPLQVGSAVVGGPAFSGAGMAMEIAGGKIEELEKKGVPHNRSVAAGFTSALLQAPMEAFGLSRIANVFKPQQILAQRLKSWAEAAGTEAMTEFFQEYPDAAAEVFAESKNPSRVLDNLAEFTKRLPETTRDAAYSALLGGMIGGTLALPGLAFQRHEPIVADNAQRENRLGPEIPVEEVVPPQEQPVETQPVELTPGMAREASDQELAQLNDFYLQQERTLGPERQEPEPGPSTQERLAALFPLAGKREGGPDMVSALADQELRMRPAREAMRTPEQQEANAATWETLGRRGLREEPLVPEETRALPQGQGFELVPDDQRTQTSPQVTEPQAVQEQAALPLDEQLTDLDQRIQGIAAAAGQSETALRNINQARESLAALRQETHNDRATETGLVRGERIGEEPGRAVPGPGEGGEASAAGGVLQTPKQVAPVQEGRSIRSDELVNGVTRDQAGSMMASGDRAVLEHIREGVRQHGMLPMQDAVRNEMQKQIASVPRGRERDAVRRNIRALEPEINAILDGRGAERAGKAPETAPGGAEALPVGKETPGVETRPQETPALQSIGKKLGEKTSAFVRGKVEAAGSMEEVERQYPRQDAVSKYAREYGSLLYAGPATQKTPSQPNSTPHGKQAKQGDETRPRKAKEARETTIPVRVEQPGENEAQGMSGQEKTSPGTSPLFSRSETGDKGPAQGVGSGHGEVTEDLRRLREEVGRHHGIDLPEDAFTSDVPDRAVGEGLDAIARAFGKRLVFFKSSIAEKIGIAGTVLPGDSSTIFLDTQATQDKPHLFVLGHELTHTLKEDHPDLYDALFSAVIDDAAGLDRYRDRLNALTTAQGAAPLSDSHAAQELVGDVTGERFLDRDFWTMLAHRKPDVFERIAEFVKRFIASIINKLRGKSGVRQYVRDFERVARAVDYALSEYAMRQADVKSSGVRLGLAFQEDPVRASLDETPSPASVMAGRRLQREQAVWAATLDAYVGRGMPQSGRAITVGSTPDVLLKLGADDHLMTMPIGKVYKVLHKQGMTLDLMKQLPRLMADPVAVFDSTTMPNARVVLTDALDADGNPTLIAVHLDVGTSRSVVNEVSSFYGKENAPGWINRQINERAVRYLNKTKASQWQRSAGLQLPLEMPMGGRQTVLTEADVVNPYLPAENESLYTLFGEPTKGMDRTEVQAVINGLQAMAKNAPDIRVVQRLKDLPKRILERYMRRKRRGLLQAAYDIKGKRSWVVADNIPSRERVLALWLHEQGLHHGLRGIFGDETQLRNLLDMVYRSAPKKALKRVHDLYDLPMTLEGRLEAAEEYMASLAEKVSLNEALAPEEKSVWRLVVQLFRRMVKSVFGRGGTLTEQNIADIVHDAVRWTLNGWPTGIARRIYERASGEQLLPVRRGNSRPPRFALSGETAQDFVLEAEKTEKAAGIHFMDSEDLGAAKKALMLPHWVSKHFPEFKPFYLREIQRTEERSERLLRSWEKVGEALKGLDRRQKDELRSVIWQVEGRKIKGVDADKSKSVGNDENGNAILIPNREHYEQLASVMSRLGVSRQTVNAFVAIRKSLDADLLQAYERLRSMKEGRPDSGEIDKFRQEMGQVHNYFPHIRYGRYYLKGMDESGKTVFRQHFDAPPGMWKRKAAALERELKQKFPDVRWESGENQGLPEDIYEYPIPVKAMEQVIKAATDKLPGQDEQKRGEIRDLLHQTIANVLKERGWGRHTIRRLGIPGHETRDIERVLWDYKAGLYGWLTKMDAAHDYSKLLWTIDAKSKPRLYSYASRYVRNMLENSDRVDRIVNGAKSLFFLQYLGFNLKSAAVNLTQNLVTGIPRLSLDVSTGRAAEGYFRGAANALVGFVTKNRHLAEDEQRLLKDLYFEGTTQANLLREIQGSMGGRAGRAYERLIAISGLPMAVAERFNRTSLALAAYRAARDGRIDNGATLKDLGLTKGQKADYGTAKRFAETVTLDAHFVYGKANRPELFRGSTGGKLLSSAYTFRSFSHNLLSLWRWMFGSQGWRGRRAVAYSMLATWTMGGLVSLPLYKTLASLFRQLFGDDPTEEIRKASPNWARDLITYGVFAPAGVSISGSLGMELPILDRLELDKPIGQQVSDKAMEVVGIPAAMLEQFGNAFDALTKGDWWRLMESIVPQAASNPMKAYKLWTQGQHAKSGRPIALPGEKAATTLSGREAVTKALGFQPLKAAKSYDLYRTIEDLKNYKDSKQNDLLTAWMRAKNAHDREGMREAEQERREWNRRMRSEGRREYLIDPLPQLARYREKPQQPAKPMRSRARELRENFGL